MRTHAFAHGMGWIPDLPDFRDYTAEHPLIRPLLRRVGLDGHTSKPAARKKGLPASTDLRNWCSPVEDQGKLGSCTAQAGVGMLEYYERRAFAKHIEASRLFLYKATRNLMHEEGDTGAFLRTTIGAMVLFGIPPEEYWPYVVEDFDKEPTAFCYAFAHNYQAISYYLLDPPGTAAPGLLAAVKEHLAAGIPSVFGFTVYDSISDAEQDGLIPFPKPGEKVLGGHAVMAAGYDDALETGVGGTGKKPSKGALLIRNSWGSDWGQSGYGWLPYEYVLQGLAIDWWALLKTEWVDTGQFGA